MWGFAFGDAALRTSGTWISCFDTHLPRVIDGRDALIAAMLEGVRRLAPYLLE